MCRWRHVCNYYLQCGHKETQPEEMVLCDSANCKFSPNHPPTCTPPDCTKTCWQFRQFPEQYSPNIDKLCPKCSTRRR